MKEISQVEPAAYSVTEFCQAHRMTRQLFYSMQRDGTGPRIFKAGTRTLISVEAAADWRRERESVAELMEPRRGRRAEPIPACGAEPTPSSRGRIRQAGAAGIGGAA